MFNIGLHSNSYHGFTLEDAVKGAAAAGFELIELSAVRGWSDHVSHEMSDADIANVKTLLADNNLRSESLSGHANILSDDGLALLGRHAELAGRLGCAWLVTSVGEAHDDKEDITDYGPLRKALAKLLETCVANRVGLALEVHGKSFGTGKSLTDLVSFDPNPALGVCYDTANCIFYGGVKPEADIPATGRMVVCHLKEKAGKPDEWNFPAIGAGWVDFPAVFAALEKKGFTGPINIELEFTPAGPGSVAAVDKAAKDSREYLVKLLGNKFHRSDRVDKLPCQ